MGRRSAAHTTDAISQVTDIPGSICHHHCCMLVRYPVFSPAVPLGEWEDHQLAHLLGDGPEDEDVWQSLPSSSAGDDLTTCTKGGQAERLSATQQQLFSNDRPSDCSWSIMVVSHPKILGRLFPENRTGYEAENATQ